MLHWHAYGYAAAHSTRQWRSKSRDSINTPYQIKSDPLHSHQAEFCLIVASLSDKTLHFGALPYLENGASKGYRFAERVEDCRTFVRRSNRHHEPTVITLHATDDAEAAEAVKWFDEDFALARSAPY